MGKLKTQMIVEQEQEFIRKELGYKNQTQTLAGLDMSDEELARFDKEFNDWLDAYEASFGGRDYL